MPDDEELADLELLVRAVVAAQNLLIEIVADPMMPSKYTTPAAAWLRKYKRYTGKPSWMPPL